FQAEDGIRDLTVTGIQTCALPISRNRTLRPKMEVAGRRLRRIEGAALSLAPVPTSAGRSRFLLPARRSFQTTRHLNLPCHNPRQIGRASCREMKETP